MDESRVAKRARGAIVAGTLAAKSPKLVLLVVGLVCLATEMSSATWLVRDFETPNASTRIARHLVETGEYGTPGAMSLRAFQLPGEPFYLAAGLRILPVPQQRYLHLPIALLLVVSIAAAGF